MKFTFVLLALTLVFGSQHFLPHQKLSQLPSHWNDCQGSQAWVFDFDINPYPLIAKSPVNFTLHAKSQADFNITRLEIQISNNETIIQNHNVKVKLHCDYGLCSIQSQLRTHENIPLGGYYHIQVKAQNQNDKNLMCFNFSTLIEEQSDEYNIPTPTPPKKLKQQQPWPWNDCGGSSGWIIYVYINPYPLIVDFPVNYTVDLRSFNTFNITKLQISLSNYGNHIKSYNKEVELQCSSGYCSINSNLYVPKDAPYGFFDVTVNFQNEIDDNLLCLNFSTFIKTPPPPILKSIDIQNCGGSSGIIDSLDLNPYPIKLGNELSIQGNGHSSKGVKFEKITLTLFKNGIPLGSFDFDFKLSCERACSISFTQQINVPRFLKAGNYEIEVRGGNYQDDNLICAKLKGEFQQTTLDDVSPGLLSNNDRISDNPLFVPTKNLKQKQPWSWNDCGGSSGLINYVYVNIYPFMDDFPVNYTVTLRSFNNFNITKLGITLIGYGTKLKQYKAKANLHCNSGHCSFNQKLYIPKDAPYGLFDVLIKFQNKEDDNLLCLNITKLIKTPPPPPSISNQLELQDCEGSVAQFDQIDIQPNPIKTGQKVSIGVKGHSLKGFKFEKFVLTPFRNGIPLGSFEQKSDLACQNACPISLTKELQVPRQFKPGVYEFELRASSFDDYNMMCTRVKAQVQKGVQDDELQKSINFKECKTPGHKGSLAKLDFSVYPLQLDVPIAVTIQANTKEAFDITRIKFTAYVENIPIIGTNITVAGSCSKDDCFLQDVILLDSKKLPTGKLDCQAQLQNEQDDNLICARGVVEIRNQ